MDRVCGKHSKHNSRKTLLFAASILSSCFLLSQGQDGTLTITVEPPMPREGASVTLKPGTLPENVLYCRWYRESAADPNLIITGFGKVPGDNKGPKYTGRETMDSSCSLQITDLNATDSGTYIMIAGGPGVFLTGSAKFEVIEKFPKPVLLPAKYAALEHENVTLYCNISSSSAFNISWFKGEKLSKPVLSPAKYAALERENVTLYCDISSNSAFNISWIKGGLALPSKAIISEDKNLTLPDFTKDDAGTYTCAASNHFSTDESNPSIITLAYGPLNVKVEPAGFISQKVGSKLVLLCTADSNPEAQFQWFFNGTDQRVMNNTFSVDSVAWKDEGNYICQASNTITKFHGLASLFVKVTKKDSSGSGSGGLSGGAIAGIVLGSLAVMLALTGTLFCFFFCRNTLEPKNLQGGRHQGGKTESPVTPPPSYYENIASFGQVKTGAGLESSLGTSYTYAELQYKDQAVYQEIK